VERLNLPVFDIPVRQTEQGPEQIFDFLRKKWVALSPEEWVRQNLLHYLVLVKGYPAGRLGVEVSLKLFGLHKRADAILYSAKGNPVLLIECKASQIPLTTNVFAQAARYNLTLKAPFLLVSNGLQHYCSRVDLTMGSFAFLEDFPSPAELT
jgi:hypothetical protein